MCEKDAAKVDKYLANVTQMRCVWTEKETPPSVDGDALIYNFGTWSKDERNPACA